MAFFFATFFLAARFFAVFLAAVFLATRFFATFFRVAVFFLAFFFAAIVSDLQLSIELSLSIAKLIENASKFVNFLALRKTPV